MQTAFKRHQRVRLLRDPDAEYIEYHLDHQEPIKKGMTGRINVILHGGKYHVQIEDDNGEVIAYVPMNEEDLEAI